MYSYCGISHLSEVNLMYDTWSVMPSYLSKPPVDNQQNMAFYGPLIMNFEKLNIYYWLIIIHNVHCQYCYFIDRISYSLGCTINLYYWGENAL